MLRLDLLQNRLSHSWDPITQACEPPRQIAGLQNRPR
jgi:hypothetical protein